MVTEEEITRAAVYLLQTDRQDRDERQCLDHCQLHQYVVVSITVDDHTARRWGDTVRMVSIGEADVIVIPDQSHLIPTRVPRVEVADLSGETPRRRRARIINPPSGW